MQTFLDALALNWLIGGTDAHAKNFSLLLGAGGRVRLAPLYDIASRIAYDPWHPHELRLAMRIGDEYVLGRIQPRQWDELAKQLQLSTTPVWRRILDMAEALTEALKSTQEEVKAQELTDPVLDLLVERLSARAQREAGGFRQALQVRPRSGPGAKAQ